MIRSIRANDPNFKTLRLHKGLNVVLADTTETSTAKDTRNGVGKTLLMEILHFCLGASAPRSGGLTRRELTGWTFTAELDLRDQRVTVSRSLAMPGSVGVSGDFDGWPVTPSWDKELGSFRLTLAEWKRVLGDQMFRLEESGDGRRYSPTFRSAFPYFARVGTGAYDTPFKFFPGQREWQKQVAVAFLLELNCTHASRYQELKDEREALRTLKKAIEQGALGDPDQTIGRLRAQRVQLTSRVRHLEEQLENFEVHPEYRAIANEANALTAQLHELVNARVIRERTIAMYTEQAATEIGPDSAEVVRLFEEAGVQLSSDVRRSLDEAQEFHAHVIRNRQEYLRDEILGLEQQNKDAETEIESLSDKRAQLLEILDTKHALDELNRLNARLAELRAELIDTEGQISRITQIEEGQANLEISAHELARDSRRDLA